MDNTLIELALKTLSCTQKELALALGVSSTQITKWKKGEYMSSEMENKLKTILNLDQTDYPGLILLVGSKEQAKKWEKLIMFLAEQAVENDATGYETGQLMDMPELLCANTMRVLNDMGVIIPKVFPENLNIDYNDEHYDDDQTEPFEIVINNPIAALIYDIFETLTDLTGFYQAYISDLMDDETLDLYMTSAANIEPCLIELAAAKQEPDEKFAPAFSAFKRTVLEEYKEWLDIVKLAAIRHGVPLKAELTDLIYRGSYEIGTSAEAQILGLNEMRLHPDIYMNELLVGMRTVHQVLPFIMKKIGIYDEFHLDESDFYLNSQK